MRLSGRGTGGIIVTFFIAKAYERILPLREDFAFLIAERQHYPSRRGL